MLNSMQKDVLTEMINVYVGRAAGLLSEMVNQRIILSVPKIELITVSSADESSKHFPPIFTPGHIISSSMRFGQSFEGKAFLIFPAEQAKLLVNACLGEDLLVQVDKETLDFIDTDFDVLKEISNVILNAVIGEFGNFLDTKLEYSLPDIELIYVSESEQKILLKENTYILILHTAFWLAETQVKGVIMIALSMNSVTWLIEKIDTLLED
ncbi:MAG: chemotaxis protein CheC [Firmicutes bacterium HGW-Firmicutes-15]|nr:MAG: chemotaxis protein CheC [Firmicutes bacterium HGW-Firmicutes-15]